MCHVRKDGLFVCLSVCPAIESKTETRIELKFAEKEASAGAGILNAIEAGFVELEAII